MEILLLYLFTRLGPLHAVFDVGLFGGAISVYASGAWYFIHDKPAIARSFIKVSVALLVLSIVGKVLIPTQKDAALILAGYGVIEIAKSETAGRLASKSVQLIEQTLDGYLKKDAAK